MGKLKCINIKNKEFIKLVEKLGENSIVTEFKVSKWQDETGLDRFPTVDEIQSFNSVNYNLKSVDILSSDKANQIFTKGKKNNWNLNKILTELQISKNQKQIILDKNWQVLNQARIGDLKSFDIREEIITALLAENSFVVEVNTIKETKGLEQQPSFRDDVVFFINGVEYRAYSEPDFDDEGRGQLYTYYSKGLEDITKEEYLIAKEKAAKSENPTQYYSNLTVPGGTNYTENEISTPDITPNIKGHAQFSTDNGIGWFRSDEQKGRILEVQTEKIPFYDWLKNNYGKEIADSESKKINSPFLKTYNEIGTENTTEKREDSKTRRILEVQSDLFQKSRNNKDLIGGSKIVNELGTHVEEEYENNGFLYFKENDRSYVKNNLSLEIGNSNKFTDISFEEYDKNKPTRKSNTKENQFLQLLNKKGNWVKFFIQSIVQDSVKKGYGKVLFPTGETAAKVEGHETISHEIKEIDKYVLELANDSEFDQSEEIKKVLERKEDLLKNGLSKLKPIEGFYTNKITNILNKLYDVKIITDEHGNTWNEVDITKKINQSEKIYLKKIESLINPKADPIFNNKENNVIQQETNFKESTRDILFNNNLNGSINSKEVLSNIINKSINLSHDFKRLALLLLEKSDAKVSFRPHLGTSFMGYQPSTRTIFIDKNSFDKVDTATMVEGFVHEVMHEILTDILNNPKTIDQKIFVSSLNEQYNNYKKLFKKSKKNYSEDIAYGFINIHEFTAELMSSNEFKKTLYELDSENNSSFFKKIINAIKSLFGFKNSDNVSDMFEQILNFTNNFEYTRTNNSYVYKKIIEKYDDIKTNKTGIDNKYNNLMDNIKNSLDLNINRFADIAKKLSYNDEKASERVSQYAEELQSAQDKIEKFRDANSAAALTTFTNSMMSTLNVIETRFSEVKNKTVEENIDFYSTYRTYLDTYAVAGDIQQLLAELKHNTKDTMLSIEELNEVSETLNNAIIKHGNLVKESLVIQKNIIKDLLTNIDYFPEIITKYTNILSKDYKQLGISQDKESWINNKLFSVEIQESINKDIEETIEKLIENDQDDIGLETVFFNAGVNVNSKLVSILTRIIGDIKQERINTERLKDLEFNKLFKKLAKDRNSKSVSKLYKNLIQFDGEGKAYFKGLYKTQFIDLVHNPIKQKRIAIRELNDAYELDSVNNIYPINSSEYKIRLKTKNDKIKKLKAEIKKIEKANFIYDKDGVIESPKSKWLNNTSNLSDVEKEVLDYFINLTESNNELYRGNNNLITYTYKTKFYELPKITKNSSERILNDGIKSNTIGKIKDGIDNLKKNRGDDFGYSVQYENAAGDKKYALKQHYRNGSNNFRHQDQSLDLVGIMRMDYKASNAYKIRRNHENKLNMLIDVAKNKEFVDQKGNKPDLSSFNKKQRSKKGITSGTHNKMVSILESSFYDVLSENSIKIAKMDANKVVGAISGVTSFLQLSLNIASATANVVNGSAQLFLESFLKGQTISAKSIAKANKLYSLHLSDTLKDITRPINTSYTNQLNELFDASGLFNLSKADFIKTNLAKQGFSFETLQMFQQSGENWMQSVIVMSVLDGVKVMNGNGKFINKDGKVVKSKKEAASLLDMSIKDPETGIVNVSDKVVYTTHSKLTKWNKNGKTNVDLLIRKKLYDILGNYSEMDQPEIMKHWYGKLLMLYRKYLIPMGITRWRGFTSSTKRKDDLLNNEIFYSEALQQYEEGTYVSLIRFISTTLKDKKYSLMMQNWDSLTDYEKHNIKKSVTEIVMTTTLLPLIGTLLKAIADDEDNEVLFFLAYQIRRLETEISAYRSLGESFKMLRSPIPSLKLIEDSIEITHKIFTPWNWDEEYESGRRAGENKLRSKLLRTMPIFKEFQRTYRDLYNFQNR